MLLAADLWLVVLWFEVLCLNLSKRGLDLSFSWFWDWVERLGLRLLELLLKLGWRLTLSALDETEGEGSNVDELWDLVVRYCWSWGDWALSERSEGKFRRRGSRPRTWDEFMDPWPCTILRNCCSSKYFSAAHEGFKNEKRFLIELRFSMNTNDWVYLYWSKLYYRVLTLANTTLFKHTMKWFVRSR